MNRQNKEANMLNTEINISDTLRRLRRGALEIAQHPIKRSFFIGYCVLGLLAYLLRRHMVSTFVAPILVEPMLAAYPAIFGFLFAGMLFVGVYFAAPYAVKVENALRRIDFATKGTKEPPLLMRIYQDAEKADMTVMELKSSMPKIAFEECAAHLEAALNVTIAKITVGKSNNRILIYTLAGSVRLSEQINWHDSLLINGCPRLVLGQSLFGIEAVDLRTNAHILIGGMTGSGKTILLKNLLYQCVKKGYHVYIADFKRGVDFGVFYKNRCTFASDAETVLYITQRLAEIINSRFLMLEAAECANIDQYNEKHNKPMLRLVFACDEIAQLAKKGISPEQKQQYTAIREHIETITQLGRAAGVHAILATQRGDAQVLVGQIKSNISLRICGRADAILSEITLDNRAAAEQIDKDAQGRFITDSGILFQGYWFDEDGK